MTRLLSANFARLFKGTLFRTAVKVIAGIVLYIYINRAVELHNYPIDIYSDKLRYIDRFTFAAIIYIFVLAAIVTAVFVGTDYSDGTIRNKLTAGHKRWTIYLSNLITCTTANLLAYLELIVLSFGMGRLFAVETRMTSRQTIRCIMSVALTLTALTAIIVFIAMLIHSKSASVVLALLMLFSMYAAEQIISDKLRVPEFYGDDGIYYYERIEIDEETGMVQYEYMNGKPNPLYVGGVKRIIMQNIYDAMPLGQVEHIQNGETEKIPIMAAYSLGTIAAFTGAGLWLFRKKNIK